MNTDFNRVFPLGGKILLSLSIAFYVCLALYLLTD